MTGIWLHIGRMYQHFLKTAFLEILMQSICYEKNYLHIKVANKIIFNYKHFFKFKFLLIKYIKKIILIEAREENEK